MRSRMQTSSAWPFKEMNVPFASSCNGTTVVYFAAPIPSSAMMTKLRTSFSKPMSTLSDEIVRLRRSSCLSAIASRPERSL